MKAEDYLYKHYGTNKTPQLPDAFDFDNVVDMMKHYARKKCKEQREICAKYSWDAWEPEEYGRLDDSVRNAPEPEIE